MLLTKGVEAKVTDSEILVKGPLGPLSRSVSPLVKVVMDDGRLSFAATDESAAANAMRLRDKIYASIGVNVVSYLYGPMPTQPFGWFKKPISKLDDMKGMKFRTVGLSVDMYTAMGCAVNALPGAEIVPALDRGLIEGAEFNNASSDRALGFMDVSKV